MAARNYFIISKGFRNYFTFSILFAVAEQMCATIDMILLSHFVGPDAFAALSLVTPVENLAIGILMLLTGGAGIIASRLIGDQEFTRAHKVLTVAVVSATITTLVASILCLSSIDSIVKLLCPDQSLATYVTDYLKIYFAGLTPIALFYCTTLILDIDGKPDKALFTMLAACVLDLLLDVLLMGPGKMGVRGLGLATIASYLLPLCFLLPYLRSSKVSFKFEWADEDKWKLLLQNLKFGIPYSLPFAVTCLIIFIVNSLFLKTLGLDVLYFWSTGYQIVSIAMVAVTCIGGTILVTMGSMLAGCHDMDGFKILTRKCINASALLVGMLVIPVLLFPQLALDVFGGSSIESSRDPFLWMDSVVIFIIPFAICCIKVYISQALNRSFSSVMSLLTLLGMSVLALFILAWKDPEKMYLALPAAGALFLLADFIICRLITRKRTELSRYLLIPQQDNMESSHISSPYNTEGLYKALEEISAFLESCELPPALCSGINLCCEELMLSVVEHNASKGDGYFFDILILNDEEDVKVTVKDAGFPFNPVRKYTNTAVDAMEAGEDMDLSLRLLNTMCKELTYNYMYGQNTIYMSFAK